jgi:hypothetical protein
LKKEGVRIVYRRKPDPEGNLGDYDTDTFEVNIYSKSISTKEEKELTILHELYHAKNHLIHCRKGRRGEEKAEREALKTYLKRPQVLKTAKDILTTKREE